MLKDFNQLYIKAFKISILSIHNKMNTVYAATLHFFLESGGGCYNSDENLSYTKKKKRKTSQRRENLMSWWVGVRMF